MHILRSTRALGSYHPGCKASILSTSAIVGPVQCAAGSLQPLSATRRELVPRKRTCLIRELGKFCRPRRLCTMPPEKGKPSELDIFYYEPDPQQLERRAMLKCSTGVYPCNIFTSMTLSDRSCAVVALSSRCLPPSPPLRCLLLLESRPYLLSNNVLTTRLSPGNHLQAMVINFGMENV